VIELAEH